MKKLFCLLAVIICVSDVRSDWRICNYVESISVSTGFTNGSMISLIVNEASYVNGGTTFTFPTDLFTSMPFAFVSLQLQNAAYSSSESYAAIIVSITMSDIVISVNKTTSTGVVEAATDDVIVCVSLFGSTSSW